MSKPTAAAYEFARKHKGARVLVPVYYLTLDKEVMTEAIIIGADGDEIFVSYNLSADFHFLPDEPTQQLGNGWHEDDVCFLIDFELDDWGEGNSLPINEIVFMPSN